MEFKDFPVPETHVASRCLRDPAQKIMAIRYARNAPGLPPLRQNPVFRFRPGNMTYDDLDALIRHLRQTEIYRDEMIQQGLYKAYSRRELVNVLNIPLALRREVHSILSPWRLILLDWYVSERLQNHQTPALADIMDLKHEQFMRIVSEYARQCIAPAKRLTLNKRLIGVLTPAQMQVVEDTLKLRLLGRRATLREALPDLDPEIRKYADAYIYQEVRKAKAKAQKVAA